MAWKRAIFRPELLLPLAIFLAQAVWFYGFSIDDVYISYRFAQHLAEGQGLRWNPAGPAVEGYSNFLWVLILAGGRWLGFDIETFAVLLGGVIGAGCLILLWALCRRLWFPGQYWWLPVLLIAICPAWVIWVMSGLEIALFCLFLLVIIFALTSASRSRTILLSIGLAGLSLTRPEGLALAPHAPLLGLITERRHPAKRRFVELGATMAVLAVVIVGFRAFRLSYFGYLFPNTVYAKFSHGLPSAGLIARWLIFGLPFFSAWALVWRRSRSYPCHAALATAIIMVGIQAIIVLPVVPVMAFLFRHEIALLPLVVLAAPLLPDYAARIRRAFGPTLALVLTAWMLQGWPEVIERYTCEKSHIQRQRCVAENLLSLPTRVTVALIDAGRVPYWTDLPCIDLWGLCDAEIAHRGFTYASTLGRNPDVYVMSINIKDGQVLPRLGLDVMASGNPTFKEKYRLWKICAAAPPTFEWYYNYGIFLNTDWAARNGLKITERK